jgi:hypothetical protein
MGVSLLRLDQIRSVFVLTHLDTDGGVSMSDQIRSEQCVALTHLESAGCVSMSDWIRSDQCVALPHLDTPGGVLSRSGRQSHRLPKAVPRSPPCSGTTGTQNH